MPSTPFAGNAVIDRGIRNSLELIDDDHTTRSFLIAFENASGRQFASLEVYRELLVGAYLKKQGWVVSASQLIDSMTPDWYVKTPQRAIVEVRSAWPNQDTRRELARTASGERDSMVWIPVENDTHRLIQGFEEKATKYRALVEKHDLAFVIAGALSFDNLLDIDEIAPEVELFARQRTHLSGVLIQANGRDYTYFPNPSANRPISVESGQFHP